jgi:hypothetical protein
MEPNTGASTPGTNQGNASQSHKKGWPLIKKIKWIFILAMFLAVAIFLMSTIGVNKLRSLRATSEAHTYVSQLYPGYVISGSVCQGEDTDADKYVSCDLNISNSTDSRIINIQCPTIMKSFLGTSCKQARPVLNQ